MKKSFIVPVVAIVTAGVLVAGATKVFAQSSDTAGGYTSIVQKIAQKFNLNQADVQAVFDQDRQEHEAQMEQNFEKKLTDAVSAGELTDSQKQAIIEKRKELQAQRQSEMESFKNMTEEQRQATMEAKKADMEKQRTDLEAWAKEQGIDMKYLMGRGHGGPGGFGHHFGRQSAPATSN